MPTDPPARVLVVEDDRETAALLKLYLEDAGHIVFMADRGDVGLDIARDRRPDLILLDLMLPGKDGWTVCEELRRESEVPILMLTARTQEADRCRGFELGVDDYISKPFSPREVAHRVQAVLRRTRHSVSGGIIKFCSLKIDSDRRTLHVLDQPVALTATEFQILHVLVSSPRRVFSREQLVDHLGRDFDGHIRTIDAHIGNLRRRRDADDACVIRTAIGVGYSIEGESDAR